MIDHHRNENEPLPLHELRTPMPLGDADFAAIRARVRSEIASREERRVLWPRFAFAFSAFAVVVIALYAAFFISIRVPAVPERPEHVIVKKAPVTAPVPPPPQIATARNAGVPPAGPTASRRRIRRSVPARRIQPPETFAAAPVADVAVSRIELHTTDPDIRIIWISGPTLPVKEES